MKLVKVNGSIIGVTLAKETTFIAPALAGMDAAQRKAWLFPDTTRGSFEVERLYDDDEFGTRAITFARPLTFTWSAVLNGKRRVLVIQQADLGLNTMADPASLLEDITYELREIHRLSGTATYARNPATAEQAAKVRALIKIEVLS